MRSLLYEYMHLCTDILLVYNICKYLVGGNISWVNQEVLGLTRKFLVKPQIQGRTSWLVVNQEVQKI